jgi:T4-like virus tail tube protein gp19
MTRNGPLRNFRYRLEIDGTSQAPFREVAIGETTIDIVDYREGTDPPHTRRPFGVTKCGGTLKQRLTIAENALELARATASGQRRGPCCSSGSASIRT